jgi:hypothetical protein
MVQNFKCKHCEEEFPTRGKLNHHFRKEHQQEVGINENGMEITRKTRCIDDNFGCICGKSYNLFDSLVRHQKTCRQWRIHPEDDRMDMNEPNGTILIFNSFILIIR